MKNQAVLIVDDDRQIVSVLTQMLTHAGYQPMWASTGQRGIELIFKKPISLILLDVNLPDMKGFDVCRKVRAEGYKTPVLIMSSEKQEEQVVRGLKSGANDYITKPFGMEELVSRIQTHLHWQQVYSGQMSAQPSQPSPAKQPRERSLTEEILSPLKIESAQSNDSRETKPTRKSSTSEEMPLLTRLAIRNGNRKRKNTATSRIEARDRAKVETWNREFAAKLDERAAETEQHSATDDSAEPST